MSKRGKLVKVEWKDVLFLHERTSLKNEELSPTIVNTIGLCTSHSNEKIIIAGSFSGEKYHPDKVGDVVVIPMSSVNKVTILEEVPEKQSAEELDYDIND